VRLSGSSGSLDQFSENTGWMNAMDDATMAAQRQQRKPATLIFSGIATLPAYQDEVAEHIAA
jgi:hypothetical protein